MKQERWIKNVYEPREPLLGHGKSGLVFIKELCIKIACFLYFTER